MKTLCIFLIVLTSLMTQAMVSHIKIRGTIIKYDKNSVTLRQASGRTIKVPKQSIPLKFGKLKTGKKVYALSFDEQKMKVFRKSIIYKQKQKELQKQNQHVKNKLRKMASKK